MSFSLTRNPDSINLRTLAEAFNNNQQEIQLPAFQRDTVWNEDHTELLWDSILRRFPISSLLFAKTDPKNDVPFKDLKTSRPASRTNKSSNTKFILIDGQQRSRAIALGLKLWEKGDGARLWVDLGKNDGTILQQNRFYMCSLRKPWGTRTTDTMIRDGLEALQISDLEINDETLGKTWPMRAILPVPLADLLLTGSSEWLKLVPKSKQESIPTDNLDGLLEDINKTIEYQIPVYLIENPGIDNLGIIFERLNKQGVAMSKEDMFFSALKMIWPQAHDLVWEVYSDYETGRALSPTKIVHLAVRLAAADTENPDVVVLNPEIFKRLVRRTGQQDSKYLKRLKRFLQPVTGNGSELGKLHQGLRLVRNALMYDPSNGIDDPGLPLPLVVQLKPHVWHTLVAWTIHHETIDTRSRHEMLRYACLDYFFSKTTASKLLTIPFEDAFKASNTFPGRKIYKELLDNDFLSPELITPRKYRNSVFNSLDPCWGILQNELDLVMWAQRNWINQWFPYFDPTVFAGQDLPYDVDHIIPSAHMNMRGKRYKLPKIFWSWRKPLLSSPGNLRFWPKCLNRADGKNSLEAKQILGSVDDPTSGNQNLLHYGLKVVGDIRSASIVKDDLLNWKQVAFTKDVFYFTEERLKAFRRAVDKRRSNVYDDFFEKLGFDNWL